MLEKLFHEIKSLIDSVDFSELWRGFYPMKFALYDETDAFLTVSMWEKPISFWQIRLFLPGRGYRYLERDGRIRPRGAGV